jgi:hypothetical protein
MVGIVDHPGGEPENLALQRDEAAQSVGAGIRRLVGWLDDAQLGHGRSCWIGRHQSRAAARAQG